MDFVVVVVVDFVVDFVEMVVEVVVGSESFDHIDQFVDIEVDFDQCTFLAEFGDYVEHFEGFVEYFENFVVVIVEVDLVENFDQYYLAW